MIKNSRRIFSIIQINSSPRTKDLGSNSHVGLLCLNLARILSLFSIKPLALKVDCWRRLWWCFSSLRFSIGNSVAIRPHSWNENSLTRITRQEWNCLPFHYSTSFQHLPAEVSMSCSAVLGQKKTFNIISKKNQLFCFPNNARLS